MSIASWKCAKIRLSSSENAQNQVGVDLDHLNRQGRSAAEVRDQAMQMPYVAFAFISPSQDGVKVHCLEVWPESHWPGFALRQADVFQSYTAL